MHDCGLVTREMERRDMVMRDLVRDDVAPRNEMRRRDWLRVARSFSGLLVTKMTV